MTKKGGVKKSIGVGLEPHVIEYLDLVRQVTPFNKLSRSALVNYIIEQFSESENSPIDPRDVHEKWHAAKA